MLNHRFYTAFGELLYAIAISDNCVQEEEIEEIHKITRQLIQEYLPNSTQELNNFNALLAESGFFSDFQAGLNKDEALSSFLDFYSQNRKLFTPEIKELCIHSITRIAEAYAGIVTEEKRLILRLQEAFKK
jgi:hypothetical protein